MSGLFGGSKTQSTTPQRYNGMQLGASSLGGAVPLLYGRQRIPFNLIWYGNFRSTPNNSSGGKGGGGNQVTSYTYYTAFAAALCEGPIFNVVTVWKDKDVTTLSKEGFTLFKGAGGQATWTYLSTNFPAQAIPYDHLAYVGASNYTLGNAASMPNDTFEVDGLLGYNVAGGIYDADPSQFIPDYVTDPNHGVGRPSSFIANLSGNNNYQGYVQSLGILLSPYESTQRSASDFLRENLQITNSDGVWTSTGQLKIIPYCDAPVSGNGFSYTPNLTPVFSFTDDDFIPDDPPVKLTRKPITETYNHVRVEYLDRSNAYNIAVAEATDLGDIALNGERIMSTLSFHSITSASVARLVAQLILQASLYERNTYTFRVRPDYGLLEPMDYIAITDPALGLNQQLCRVTRITDDKDHNLEIECMKIPGTVRNAPLYNWQPVQGYNANFATDPGNILPPVFFEARSTLVGAVGGRQLWMAVAPPTINTPVWGGCNIYMSFDNVNYTWLGTVKAPSRFGTITNTVPNTGNDPDTTSTISVSLSNTTETLLSGSQNDADEARTLIAVGSGATAEIMSYTTASLVSSGNYNLTDYLRRGLYGTVIQQHASGSQFIRLDGDITAVDMDPGWMGQTLYFKFASFNLYGRAEQDLSTVTAYTYTPSTSTSAYDTSAQSGFNVYGDAVLYSLNSAFKKSTGQLLWDSALISTDSYTNGCAASLYVGNSPAPSGQSNLMFGLTSTPGGGTNYTNIDFGIHFVNSGGPVIQVYESGVNVGNFGTYTDSDLFAVTHDGKHVVYWKNGVAFRSVPIGNATYNMMVGFACPGVAVYGLDFSSTASAVTPFTLVPMTNNVGATGTHIYTNNQFPTVGWGQRCVQSKQSFKNGCVFAAELLSGFTGAVCIGLATTPVTGNVSDPTGGSPFTAAWYPHSDSGTTAVIFNGAAVANDAPPAVNDVLTITYDTYWFRWFRNGALIHQEYSPNVAPLYLFFDCFYPNATPFKNISIASYGSATPNPFVTTGSVSTHDSTAVKSTGGAQAWDSSIYSLNGYTTAHMQFKPSSVTNNRVIAGLNVDPTLDGSYTSIDVGWYIDTGTNTWRIFESGTDLGAYGTTPSITDLAVITYDGTSFVYYLNGVQMRSVSAPGRTVFFDSSFYDPGASIYAVSFGPGTTIDTVPTALLDPNAAGQIISVSTNQSFGIICSAGTSSDTALIGISPTIKATGYPIGIDAIIPTIVIGPVSASTVPQLTSCIVSVQRDGSNVGTTQADLTSAVGANTTGARIWSGPLTLSVVDNPPAGNHTYTISVHMAVSGASGAYSFNYVNPAMKLREYKR